MGRLLTALRRIESRTEADRLVTQPEVAATAALTPEPIEPSPWNEEPAASWEDAFQEAPSVDYFAPWRDLTPAADAELKAEPEAPELQNSEHFATTVAEESLAESACSAVEEALESIELAETPSQTDGGGEAPAATASVVQPAALAEFSASQPQWVAEPGPALPGPISPAASTLLVAEAEVPADAALADDQDEDEPVATVRLPGYGRPPRSHRAGAEGRLGGRQPALVPFKPAAQRPYREVCENILSALPAKPSAALLLTWADDDVDQALLCARIAETLADRQEDPVLLIDLGPKRRLSSLLRAPALGNLAEALAGLVTWRDQIVQTATAGLCVLPSGSRDFETDPVAVARLIEGCKEDFGTVLITGGALSAMPENILQASDAAVLLVEAGCTSTAAASAAIQRLRRCGVDVMGCILTGICDVEYRI